MKRLLKAFLLIVALTTPAWLIAQEDPGASGAMDTSFLSALTGDEGGEVNLNWVPLPGDEYADLRMRTSPEGEVTRMSVEARVDLRSPKINLESNFLNFNVAEQSLEATGEVRIRQEGVDATCEEMTYDLETGVIILTGSPVVNRESEGGTARFEGMEVFQLVQKEDGSAEILLNGGEAIVCDLQPKDGAGTESGGMAGIGRRLNIVTRSAENKDPRVLVATSVSGAMDTFQAFGSVVLDSDDLNLRSDQLLFDANENTLRALQNVFIQQDNIEAECGQMDYDFSTDEIVLTGNPYAAIDQGDQIMEIINAIRITIFRYEDGSVDHSYQSGPEKQASVTYRPKESPTPTPAPEQGGAREIDLNDPSAVEQITE